MSRFGFADWSVRAWLAIGLFAAGCGTQGAVDLNAGPAPVASIRGVTLAEGESGSTAFVFSVTLDRSPFHGRDVRVRWETADGTAVAGRDFGAASSFLTFTENGPLTQTVTVQVWGDLEPEPEETFSVNLAAPVNATLGAASATGTIVPDEGPSLSIADAELIEQHAGTRSMEFAVTLSREPAEAAVAVSWATSNGTATAGTDYTAASGTLSFTRGQALTQTIRVELAGDTAVEPSEFFSVVLSNPTNAALFDASARGTILADDFPDVSIADVSRAEGDSGATAFGFVVTLSAAPPSGLPLTLEWSASPGSATAPADFVAGSGTLTFSPGGALSQTINVFVVGDTAIEPAETFTVTLSNFVNGPATSRQATGTIVSDDLPRLSVSDATGVEGTGAGSTALTFTVSLDVAPLPGQDISVNWATASGSALSGTDFTLGSGSLTFTSADWTARTVSVEVLRDALVEADETFRVDLVGPTNANLADGTGVGTIQADDFPTLSIAPVSATEGDSATKSFAFAVSLSAAAPTGYPVTVSYATSDGTAVAASDFQAKTGTLTFPAGSSTQDATVLVVGDTEQEPDETFTVTLSAPTNASLAAAAATGTIVSDDPPRASIADLSIVEGNGGSTQAVFTVTLTGNRLASGDPQLSWKTVDGSARAGADFEAASGTLTFAAGGPAAQTFVVNVLGDAAAEPDEVFGVELTATANVTVGQSVGFARVLDDDAPVVTIAPATRAEGSTGTTDFTFVVSVDPAPQAGLDVQVDWTTAERTATAGADFTAASGTLTFTSAGATSSTITVPVLGDLVTEPHEEFAVVLSGVTNARLRGERALGTILDDDGATVYVDPTSTAPADGLSWASAFHTVQEAVDEAQGLGGGQVWVAAGRYTNGGGTGTLLAMRSGVSILGGFEGYRGGSGAQETDATARDPEANRAVLDGAGTALHVVTGADNAVLDGFTITGGNASGGAAANDADRRGGGMDLDGVSPVIARCTFRDNRALGNGGGLYVNKPLAGARAKPFVHDCRFVGNTAGSEGGGLYVSQSDPTVEDSVLYGNSATTYGGGFADNSGNGLFDRVRLSANRVTSSSGAGGGGRSSTSTLTLRSCEFLNNASPGSGGGLAVQGGSLRILGSSFLANTAASSGGGLQLQQSATLVVDSRVEHNAATSAGGILIANAGTAPVRLVRVRVANNRATGANGGGLLIQWTGTVHPVIADSVIEGNSAEDYGGGLYNQGASPRLLNTTLLDNLASLGGELYNLYASYPYYNYSTPQAVNTVILNRTFLLASNAVYSESGSYLSSSYSLLPGGVDPKPMHVPLRTNRTGLGSTASVLALTSVGTAFQVNDVVEVNDDGVPRTVAAVSGNWVTVAPALAAAPALYTRVDNWGPGATDLAVDLRPAPGSPCIDAGANAQVPADSADLDGDGNTTEPLPFDFAGAARFLDDTSVTDTGSGLAPVVDIGAFERVP